MIKYPMSLLFEENGIEAMIQKLGLDMDSIIVLAMTTDESPTIYICTDMRTIQPIKIAGDMNRVYDYDVMRPYHTAFNNMMNCMIYYAMKNVYTYIRSVVDGETGDYIWHNHEIGRAYANILKQRMPVNPSSFTLRTLQFMISRAVHMCSTIQELVDRFVLNAPNMYPIFYDPFHARVTPDGNHVTAKATYKDFIVTKEDIDGVESFTVKLAVRLKDMDPHNSLFTRMDTKDRIALMTYAMLLHSNEPRSFILDNIYINRYIPQSVQVRIEPNNDILYTIQFDLSDSKRWSVRDAFVNKTNDLLSEDQLLPDFAASFDFNSISYVANQSISVRDIESKKS